MKIRRIFIITLAVLTLCAGLISGLRIFYGVFLILCLACLFSIIFTLCIIFTLRYSESVSDLVIPKGSKGTLKIHVQSNLPLPIPRLELMYNIRECSIKEMHQTKQIWLNPFGNTYTNIDFDTEYAGIFTIGLVGITTYCPFGLYKIHTDMKRFRYHLPIEILVLPTAQIPENISLDSIMNEGNNTLTTHMIENSVQVDYPKTYVYGDSMRSIHWKLSMRLGELFSKKYEETSHPNLVLLLDCFDHRYTGLDAIQIEDTITEAASSIINYTLTNSLSTKFIAYSDNIIRLNGSSVMHYDVFIECIARMTYHGKTTINNVLRVEPLESADGVILLTTDISTALFDELVWLKAKGIVVRVLCITLHQASSSLRKVIVELMNQGIHTVHLAVQEDVLQAVGKI